MPDRKGEKAWIESITGHRDDAVAQAASVFHREELHQGDPTNPYNRNLRDLGLARGILRSREGDLRKAHNELGEHLFDPPEEVKP